MEAVSTLLLRCIIYIVNMNIECVCDAISCQYCSVYSTGPTHSIGSGNIEGSKNNAVNDETADFEFCVCLSLVYDDYRGGISSLYDVTTS